MGKFINPFTDFGFKHIFGREMDKDILIRVPERPPRRGAYDHGLENHEQ